MAEWISHQPEQLIIHRLRHSAHWPGELHQPSITEATRGAHASGRRTANVLGTILKTKSNQPPVETH